jgi:hypothetical protein
VGRVGGLDGVDRVGHSDLLQRDPLFVPCFRWSWSGGSGRSSPSPCFLKYGRGLGEVEGRRERRDRGSVRTRSTRSRRRLFRRGVDRVAWIGLIRPTQSPPEGDHRLPLGRPPRRAVLARTPSARRASAKVSSFRAEASGCLRQPLGSWCSPTQVVSLTPDLLFDDGQKVGHGPGPFTAPVPFFGTMSA